MKGLKIALVITLIILLLAIIFSQPVSLASRIKVEKFDLEQIRLLEGSLFLQAEELNKKILLAYNPDRLLAKFRMEAGLKPKAEPYGGWGAERIAGHSLGHYLSACSLMFASTSDSRFKERVDYIVDELELCQKANGNGYVMCVPRGKELFNEVSEGKIETQRFNLNGCWVPITGTFLMKLNGSRSKKNTSSNREKSLTFREERLILSSPENSNQNLKSY